MVADYTMICAVCGHMRECLVGVVTRHTVQCHSAACKLAQTAKERVCKTSASVATQCRDHTIKKYH